MGISTRSQNSRRVNSRLMAVEHLRGCGAARPASSTSSPPASAGGSRGKILGVDVRGQWLLLVLLLVLLLLLLLHVEWVPEGSSNDWRGLQQGSVRARNVLLVLLVLLRHRGSAAGRAPHAAAAAAAAAAGAR